MVKWIDVVKNGLKMLVNKDEYCYFYGAKGEKMDRETMERLYTAYPARYAGWTAEEKERLFSFCEGKIGYDCSGFVGVLTGDMSYSGALISHCLITTTPQNGVAGSVLYKNGHVGIDIGYGYFLHMPSEFRTVEIGKISEYDWEKSGEHQLIDYTGASAE